ncbi:hypothetical protein GG804_23815 [Sphingomonas histidinilytica]|jgi:hypothetical protein|uniref:Uncharacterized protein n=1 Tax=Rhizorhabdus histidinilytica TaxID=439228 RepID=A0A1T4ZRQ6_9SPHN|nr:hypothetical protein [Rhizorhabdus histidinilytica]MBO9379801.1 hypothetical protein [Rhizorhabdus histidinilytica]QEH78719.1 hypothetical protein EIK56_11370 [Sphingomonas sp. C8-2]SKB25474.1 hypothetical protein SAMN06295920_101138 [Rhizorhabdus histidinilytica]
MKIDINKFRVDGAEPADAPLDFATLRTLLARHQAETPTARLARDGEWPGEPSDHASRPAVAVLLSGPGQPVPTGSQAHGSFHAAAAALFNPRS